MKVTFACILKLGGDYLPEHVQLLAAQVKDHTTLDYEFVCFTDYTKKIEGVTSIQLVNGWPGWWSVPEVFRQKGPTVVVGVDTVIRGSLDGLFKIALESKDNDFWMIRSFRPPVRTISGIMVWNGDWSWLYHEFNFKESVSNFLGEEDYTNNQLKKKGIKIKVLQDSFPGIYSWKRHCGNKVPDDCSVLIFHGHPRPFEVVALWKEILEKYYFVKKVKKETGKQYYRPALRW